MSAVLIYTILTAVIIAVAFAIVLYFASVKFKVVGNPLIGEVEEVLPATNCGGCGYPGCRPFAEATTKADDLDNLYCTVGGNETMKEVAKILGLEAVEKDRVIAVLRCNGTEAMRPHTNEFDGASNCTVASSLYSGETGCSFGCVGLGECVDVCDFDALHMDPVTGLPVVNEDNCTACNACVEACPKDLFELRSIGKGKKNLRIYVACMNEEKGNVAKKACEAACIGCSKCVKVCPADAITVENSLAYIDYELCTSCRKCVYECPTDAILDINFPPRKAENPNKKPAKKPVAKKAVQAIDAPELDLTKMVKDEPKADKKLTADSSLLTDEAKPKAKSKQTVDKNAPAFLKHSVKKANEELEANKEFKAESSKLEGEQAKPKAKGQELKANKEPKAKEDDDNLETSKE